MAGEQQSCQLRYAALKSPNTEIWQRRVLELLNTILIISQDAQEITLKLEYLRRNLIYFSRILIF